MGVRKKYQRPSDRVTRTPRWRALRLAAKRRDAFKCVKCGSRGRLEVDHIKPVRTHPELSFELSNLQTLCPSCHSKKTCVEVGMAPADPERQRWRDMVRALHRNGKGNSNA